MNDEYGGFADGLSLGGGAGVERDRWGTPVDPIYDNYGHFRNNGEGGGDNGGGYRPRPCRGGSGGCLGGILTFIGGICIFFFWSTLAFIVELYASFIVTFYTPTEYDYVDEFYKMAAARGTEELLYQAQEEKWGNYGLEVMKPRGFFRTTFDGLIVDTYWRWHKGEKVAIIFTTDNKSIFSINGYVSYVGNHTYRVSNMVRADFFAVGVDGKSRQECAESKSIYIATVKCNPKRNWYGTMDMGWELLDVETENSTLSDEEIMEKVESTPIPKDIETIRKEGAKDAYEEKMKNQPVI